MNTEHFNSSEFACNCCGEEKPNTTLLVVLELVREHFKGRAVTITSGFRCHDHNVNVGGSSHSQHLFGTAADIQVDGIQPWVVYNYIDCIFPNNFGLGRYQNFTHVDVREKKARW